MHLDDLDVESGTEPLRRPLDQLRKHGNAHAHVRCEDNRDDAGVPRYLRLAVRVETGGPDDRRDARARTGCEMRERAGRAREVDQYVATADDGVYVCGDANAGCMTAPFARVEADRRAAFDIERTGERQTVRSERRLDQRLAHSATGAGDCDPHRHAREFRCDAITCGTRRGTGPRRSFRQARSRAAPSRSRID